MQGQIYLQKQATERRYEQVQVQEQTVSKVQAFLKKNRLTHNDFPNQKRGLDGMIAAHKILEERGDVGILIGGLLKECWNGPSYSERSFNKHKDVDVLIPKTENNYENFFGGVDWWIPCSPDADNQTYQNGFNCVLNYKLKARSDLHAHRPGLYIPTNEDRIRLKILETKGTDYKNELDEKDMEELLAKLSSDVSGYFSPVRFGRDIRALGDLVELIK